MLLKVKEAFSKSYVLLKKKTDVKDCFYLKLRSICKCYFDTAPKYNNQLAWTDQCFPNNLKKLGHFAILALMIKRWLRSSVGSCAVWYPNGLICTYLIKTPIFLK